MKKETYHSPQNQLALENLYQGELLNRERECNKLTRFPSPSKPALLVSPFLGAESAVSEERASKSK